MAFAHRYNKGCGVGNEKDWTPPGFSRWYFNFRASQKEEEQARDHQLVLSERVWFVVVAAKLKNHRLKHCGVN
jgi:hypothetical protein